MEQTGPRPGTERDRQRLIQSVGRKTSHPPMERIPEIDGLRALAALSVFASHAFAFTLVRVTGAGWIGVDLFFVISGYLITSILLGMRGTSNYFKNFYMRRSLRIFPPYYALLLLCLLSGVFARNYHVDWRLWLDYALYGSSLTAVQSWYLAAAAQPGLASSIQLNWSLSIEEIFYLLWAPAVRFLRVRYLFLIVISAILIAPVVRWYVHSPGQSIEYYFFPARMDSLALGSLLALLRHSGRRIHIPGWVPVAGLTVPLALLLLIPNPRGSVLFAVFGYTLLAIGMALVVAFVLDRSATGHPVCRVLRSRLLVRLGTISYMFYLIHLFVYLVVSGGFNLLLFHDGPTRLVRSIEALVSLAVTVGVAELSWRYFESPILRLKSRFSSKQKKIQNDDEQEPFVPSLASVHEGAEII
jgi:peptidoglycan/LPS O-acetylase OafA/YrhL